MPERVVLRAGLADEVAFTVRALTGSRSSWEVAAASGGRDGRKAGLYKRAHAPTLADARRMRDGWVEKVAGWQGAGWSVAKVFAALRGEVPKAIITNREKPGAKSLAEFRDWRLEEVRREGASYSTLNILSGALGSLARACGEDFPVAMLDQAALTRWDDMLASSVKVVTWRSYRAVVESAFRKTDEEGLLDGMCGERSAEILRALRRTRPRWRGAAREGREHFFREDELPRLLAALQTREDEARRALDALLEVDGVAAYAPGVSIRTLRSRWRVRRQVRQAVTLSLLTLARVSSITALRREDVLSDRLHFWRAKGGKPYSVPMTPPLRAVLDELLTDEPLAHVPGVGASPYLFPFDPTMTDGAFPMRHTAGLSREFRVVVKETFGDGDPRYFHDLRRTGATLMQASDRVVAKGLNHSGLTLIPTYRKAIPAEVVTAFQGLSELVLSCTLRVRSAA